PARPHVRRPDGRRDTRQREAPRAGAPQRRARERCVRGAGGRGLECRSGRCAGRTGVPARRRRRGRGALAARGVGRLGAESSGLVKLGVEAALVRGELVPGDVEVEDGRIVAVGLAPGPRGRVAIPGFVDLQVNGYGGVDFLSASSDDYSRAGEALLLAGVTAYQPTFITSAEETTIEALREMPMSAPGPRILGAHVEGPFLSPDRPGTHPLVHLRDPDVDLLDRLLDAGVVTQMTLAPELAGADALVERLR